MKFKFRKKILGILGILFIFGVPIFFLSKSYLVKKPSNFKQVPLVKLYDRDIYFLKSDIEDNEIYLELDTGSSFYFSLQKKTLENLMNKEKSEPREWFDGHNNRYVSQVYNLEHIRIENIIYYKKIPAEEESKEFLTKNAFVTPYALPCEDGLQTIENENGRIGMSALRLFDYWLFDFPKSSFYVIKDLEKFKSEFRYSFDQFCISKSSKFKNLALIEVQTSCGIKKMIIDTGTEISILDKGDLDVPLHQQIELQDFKINGIDFGPQNAIFVELSDAWEADGFIGMNFLKDRAILFDFKENRVFIGPKENSDSTLR